MASMMFHSVRNTVVGDEFLRGVSGGERKRVTIAEALMGQASLLLLDDYTKVLSVIMINGELR